MIRKLARLRGCTCSCQSCKNAQCGMCLIRSH